MRGTTSRCIGFAAAVAAVAAGAAVDVHAAGTAYPGGTWSPPPATYDVVATKGVRVRMDDGAELAVDVYRPAVRGTTRRAPGRFPVLLTQTPYTTSIGATSVADSAGPGDYFVRRGYVYASADVRGTGRSGGAGGFFSPRDARDGAALVTWAAHVDGGNGVVGLHGCSYLGSTQLYTASQLRPGTPVKAMIPACVNGDPFRDTYMVNGIPAPQWEGAGLLAGTLLGPTIEAAMVPHWIGSQAGGDEAYDGTFWRDRNAKLAAPAIVAAGIPALLWNGWHDAGFGGLELWTALQDAHLGRSLDAPVAAGDAVSGRDQLLLGDWGHGGGLDEGVQLQWYETWLKGVRTGLATDTATPIHAQEQASGRWVDAASYPFTDTYTRVPLAGGRTIAWAPPATPGASAAYETAPLREARTWAGPGAVHLRASSTGADLQLMVDVDDVAPDGTATPITHGGVLGSLRALDAGRSWHDGHGLPVRPFLALRREQPLTPGEIVDLDVPLRPALRRIAPGHRLRLRVVGQEEAARCAQKAGEITTDAVGCRPRAVVAARLAGATFTLHDGSFASVPLVAPAALRTTRSGRTPTSPAALPLDW